MSISVRDQIVVGHFFVLRSALEKDREAARRRSERMEISVVVLLVVTVVMLCGILFALLWGIRFVMLCGILFVLFCGIPLVMLCGILFPILCGILFVMLCVVILALRIVACRMPHEKYKSDIKNFGRRR